MANMINQILGYTDQPPKQSANMNTDRLELIGDIVEHYGCSVEQAMDTIDVLNAMFDSVNEVTK